MEDRVMAQDTSFTVISNELPRPGNIFADAPPAHDDVASLAYWQRVTELSPTNFSAHTQIGHLLFKAGELEEAQESYRRAFVLRPGHVPSIIGLSRIAQRLGNYEEALSDLLPLVEKHPDNADAALLASSLLSDCERMEEAEAVLARAVAKRGSHVGLLSALARLTRSADHRTRALQSWLKILELEPRNVNAMVQASRLLLEQQSYAQAERLLRITIDAAPGHRPALTAMASLLYSTGRDEEALAFWDAALALDGEAMPARIQRAGVLTELNRFEEALLELRAARQAVPKNGQIVRLLARAEERAERWKVALGHWQSIVTASPGNREAADHVRLCRILIDRDATIRDQEQRIADGAAKGRRRIFGQGRNGG